jgi:Beta protein
MSQLALHVPPAPSKPALGARYVPLLLDRAGERRALSQCDESVWESMTPLIAVTRYGELPTHGALKSRAKALLAAVGVHPFYLDLARIPACRKIHTSAGPRQTLAVLHEEAARRSLNFMPVVQPTDRPCHIKIAAGAVTEFGRGLALRHPLGSRVRRTGELPGDRLLKTVEALSADPADTDLLLDLQWLDPDTPVSSRWITREIQALAACASWRRIVLAGTCVPKSLGAIASLDKVGTVGRSEWELWKTVDAAVDVPLDYGDYGVQHPVPPSSGGRTFGNLRYTTETEFVVSRGHLMSNMDDGDFGDMCRRIIRRPAFSGPEFSWGDAEIARIAEYQRSPRSAIFDYDEDDGGLGPGISINGHGFWRAVATSHHLKFACAQLANYEQATA